MAAGYSAILDKRQIAFPVSLPYACHLYPGYGGDFSGYFYLPLPVEEKKLPGFTNACPDPGTCHFYFRDGSGTDGSFNRSTALKCPWASCSLKWGFLLCWDCLERCFSCSILSGNSAGLFRAKTARDFTPRAQGTQLASTSTSTSYSGDFNLPNFYLPGIGGIFPFPLSFNPSDGSDYLHHLFRKRFRTESLLGAQELPINILTCF